MNEIEKLVYGKQELTNIVGMEINDDKAVIFREVNGEFKQENISNKFWILTPTSLGSKSVRLKGDLYYKWGTQYKTHHDWNQTVYDLRKKKIDLYTVFDHREALQVKDGYTYFKGMKHTDPSILSFDIEATGLFHDENSKVLLISNTFRKAGKIERKLFCYDEFTSEREFFEEWSSWVRDRNPAIICGHNIYTYDLPYMQYCANKVGAEINIGRDGSELKINKSPSKFRIDGSRDQEYYKCRVYGRELIDTMFLAIKHDVAAKKYESYGLKNIIKVEKLEKEDREFYDASKIRFNYNIPEEWEKIKKYCEHDADDALAVFDLTAPATFYLTQSVPKPFQLMVETATGSQLNVMMVRSYLQDGHSIPKPDPVKQYEGAISFGNPGVYRNVHKIDVASLYPSIVLTCKVFDEDKDPNGNFLKIMETFTAERLKNKKLAKETGDNYYDGLQNAQKIVINSGYGFMGAPGLHFNSPSAAEFITATGRDILNVALKWAETKGYRVPNGDTDSISYTYPNQEPISEEDRKANLAEINALCPELIKWEDDGYYLTVLICKAKNYVLYDGKKVKIKGSALKATTKALALRELINEIIQSILDYKDNQQEIYLKYVKEAANVKDIKRWASRKTISDKVLNNDRTNEVRVREAIEGTEIVEGDRVWLYNKSPTELALVDKFDGNYDVAKLLQQCYDTAWTFENVLDCESLFKNYKLKKNKKELQELLG